MAALHNSYGTISSREEDVECVYSRALHVTCTFAGVSVAIVSRAPVADNCSEENHGEMSRIARKPMDASGSGARKRFADLLLFHLERGTRPRGTLNKLGKAWTNQEFGSCVQAAGSQPGRKVSNWRRGEDIPSQIAMQGIERELFGDNPDYSEWKRDLRNSYNFARSSGNTDQLHNKLSNSHQSFADVGSGRDIHSSPSISGYNTNARTSARPTIWFIGSYTGLHRDQIDVIRKVIVVICGGLARIGARVVCGESDMLSEVSKSYRDSIAGLDGYVPNPIRLEGSLRSAPLDVVFHETIGRIPDVAIVIGGGALRGRVIEECKNAEKSAIPVIAISCLGGAASSVPTTAPGADKIDRYKGRDLQDIDSGDLARDVLQLVSSVCPK